MYIASQGPLWSAGGDRGVYKTTDGGKTWTAILTVSPDTGANEVLIDPANPDVLYAAMWQRRRATGQFVGGGPESGIYKSTNAGRNWTKLATGLPKGDMGRINLGVDGRVKPTRVYAMIEALAAERGFYRSDDAGATWARVGKRAPDAGGRGGGGGGGGAGGELVDGGGGGAGARGAAVVGGGDDPPEAAPQGTENWYMNADPGYYNEFFVDPVRPDTLWAMSTNLERSDDGGKTWRTFPLQGVHVDHHAMWFDQRGPPAHPARQRRRLLRELRRGHDVAALRHAARHAVLSRVGRQHDAVLQRLRRRAGQRIDVRSAPHAAFRRHPHERLVPVRRRRRLHDAQRPVRSQLHVRDQPERRDHAAGSADGAVRRHPAESEQRTRDGRLGVAGQHRRRGGGGGFANERTNWDATYFVSPHSPTRIYWGTQLPVPHRRSR